MGGRRGNLGDRLVKGNGRFLLEEMVLQKRTSLRTWLVDLCFRLHKWGALMVESHGVKHVFLKGMLRVYHLRSMLKVLLKRFI